MKKRVVGLFLVALLFGCEEDRLVKLECVLGDKLVCNEFGQNFPAVDPAEIPERTGQCSYGTRTCTMSGWGECEGAKGPEA